MIWYSHHLKNFPQFIVIHTVKDFGIVNKAEVDIFLELACFFDNPMDAGIWSLVPLLFLNPALTSGSFSVTYCLSLAWIILSITLLACEMSIIVWAFFGVAFLWDWNENWPFPVLWPLLSDHWWVITPSWLSGSLRSFLCPTHYKLNWLNI